MELKELNGLCEKGLCDLAKAVESILKGELEKVKDVNWVMQDHWADALHSSSFRDENDVFESLNFLKNALRAMKNAAAQIETESVFFGRDEPEVTLIAEMLIGWIGYGVDDELAELSYNVKEIADRILAKKKRKMSDAACKRLVREFMDTIVPLAEKNGLRLTDENKILELNGSYLEGWFWNKCKAEK